MSAILGAVPSFSKLRGSKNDDWIDRMSHVNTVFVLVIFAIIVSTSQFAGDPIHCWLPAEYDIKGDRYEKYTEHFCWIANTYFVSFTEELPVSIVQRENREITYYQWVPLILVFQAFLFKFPNVVWKLLHPNGGLNLHKVVDMAEQTQQADVVARKEIIEHMAFNLDRWLNNERDFRTNRYVAIRDRAARTIGILCSKRSGTYLTGLFFWIKVLYVGNVIGQFFLLNAFMATDYNMFGFEVIRGLHENRPWKESPRFPRVTFCDFEIRQLENIQRFTIQCVLPINLFNEKIFIFLWFWFFFVAALSVYNLIKWSTFVLVKKRKAQFVRKYLKITKKLNSDFERKLSYKFVDHYLRDDGAFVLGVITSNSTDLVTTDLVNELWKKFQDKYKLTPTLNNGDLPANGGGVGPHAEE